MKNLAAQRGVDDPPPGVFKSSPSSNLISDLSYDFIKYMILSSFRSYSFPMIQTV